MTFLASLEQSALARYVQENPVGYPLVLTTHAVGMAVLAGIVLMINFRVLGFARDVPIHYFQRLLKLALVGFLLNLVSGVMLFVADASAHAANVAFLVKIALLITGGCLLIALTRRLAPAAGADVVALETGSTRLIAAVSVAVWIGVIVAGRLIAYVQ
ncbi:MAG: DUF6644 family protein [Pseudomonadota bacterium]|nr:DUF6644 family protein [Pseudomonadota bacterium]